MIVYVGDLPTGKISAGELLKLFDRTQVQISDVSLDLVVDEEGCSLV